MGAIGGFKLGSNVIADWLYGELRWGAGGMQTHSAGGTLQFTKSLLPPALATGPSEVP